MKEMVIDAAVENLDCVLNFINAEMDKKDVPSNLINNIDIAAEEIFVNIANYAYSPSSGSAAVRVDVGSEITVEFEDGGIQYNPLEKGEPDISSPVEEREIGGLGVFLVKKLMDTVEYRYENGKNILKMKKRLEI